MIKITPNPTFTIDVSLSIPGKPTPEVGKITFRYKCREDYLAWAGEISKKDKSYAESLPEIIESWGGEFEEPYTVENLNTLLDTLPTAGEEIVRAYAKELFVSKVKN